MTTDTYYDAMRNILPERPEDGHKGTFGHVLVLATSRGFTGTARLTAEAAGRSGAGLVTVAIPETLLDIVASMLWESMSLPLPATGAGSLARAAIEPALAATENRDAVVLGPGISTHEETQQFVDAFVRQCPIPMVIDADGLNCLSESVTHLKECNSTPIVTPHPGEMARLAACSTSEIQANREEIARQFAGEHGCVVVLKGKGTVIAAPDGACCINPTGNSGLATGGTGDVLAGFTGGLLAQGMKPYDAARLGAYVMGLAGDIAADKFTQRGMIARDVINCIPDAWRELEGVE